MKAIIFDKNKIHTIKDICDQTGLHQQTIRNWEKIGLIHPDRISGNQRIYQAQDLKVIEDIVKLKLAGIGIQSIKKILQGKYDFIN